jgi:hypothetical protein
LEHGEFSRQCAKAEQEGALLVGRHGGEHSLVVFAPGPAQPGGGGRSGIRDPDPEVTAIGLVALAGDEGSSLAIVTLPAARSTSTLCTPAISLTSSVTDATQ